MRKKLVFIIAFLSIIGTINAQTSKINLAIKNAPLSSCLSAIERQSDYTFMYDNTIDVNQNITISVKNGSLPSVLTSLFGKTSIRYEIVGKHIVLKPKSLPSESQSRGDNRISGVVTDDQGQPLPGVSVLIMGSTSGTTTDMNGSYSFSKISPNETLVFKFLGMGSQEVKVGNQSQINVRMAETVNELNEVVAIGYGTVKKVDLTGSVGAIQGDMIANRKTTQVSQALQGAVAGVMVTRSGNAPGSGATIRVRGVTTIGENNPLVIIDGVPAAGLSDVNPNDVENISVLKDAASASIYGSRAAAGVILVTTKHAKSGELSINYNMEYGMEKPIQTPATASAVRFMQFANEASWNDSGNNSNEYPLYAKDVVDNYATLNAEDPDKYPDTDWIGLIMKDYAPRESHQLSISGSTKNVRTNASIGYDKTDGLFDNKSYERYSVRLNNDITINKMLSATINFNGINTYNNNPATDPIYQMLTSPPIYAAIWANGGLAEGKSGDNIYGKFVAGGFNKSWVTRVGGKASIDFTPFSGFKLSAVIAPSLEFDKSKLFNKAVPYYASEDATRLMGYLSGHFTTALSETRNDNYNVTSQLIANYAKTFGKHSLNAMAGYENYHAFYEYLGASRDEYLLTAYPYLDMGPLTLRDNSGSATENAYRSYFGRIMYNYDNKYLLQANIRRDGSSRFYKDCRWGTFPSFSAGWVLSEEPFLKDNAAISYLKLRASWGTLGNERIGNYPYQANLSFLNALFYQGTTVVSEQSAAQIQYAIQNISWETTESYNLGVDANFLNNKLRFTGEYYKKSTRDMLLTLQIPEYMGFDNPSQNAGKMRTNGWETSLTWNDKINDLGYSISVNLSDFKSVMGDLKGTQFLGDQIKTEGSEYNEWYGYQSDGIYQTQEDVANSPKTSTSVKPGDIKYKDISGPDGVPDGTISAYDKTLLGGSLPRYMYGGTIGLDYKAFDFSLAFQGVGKQNSIYTAEMVEPFLNTGQWGNVPALIDGKYWSKYNTDEQNLKAKYPRISKTGNTNNYVMSDFWMFDGSYLRLKNMTFGYSLPKSVVSKLNIQGIRLSFSMNDFLTISKYPKGWDPENTGANYPITTSYVFGASIKF